jgi:hypothetical protein
MNDDDQLLAYVDRVERVWMRLGVAHATRRRLVVELEADLTAILGVIAGALFAWIFIETGPVGDVLVGQGRGLREQYAWIPLQALAVLVTLAGVAGAVWWRFRATPGAQMLAVRIAGLALIGGLVASAPLVGYAWATDYNTSPYALVIGGLIAAAILAMAIRLGTPRYPARARA